MIDIIIVNWNSADQLVEAVSSIAHYHCGLVSSVIIVDNASIDDSLIKAETLQNLSFQLEIIRNTDNQGFSVACNKGAKSAGNEYLLFLNPDTRLFEKSLPISIAFMQDPTNIKVGICGVQLLDETGKVSCSCARFPSLFRFMACATGIDRIFPRLGYFMAEWDHTETRNVDQVIGAFFLVRRKIFEELNGFDERFFVYFEEVDFSYRAYLAGWLSTYIAETQAFHAGGGISNHIKAQRLFYSLRSRMLYCFKHFSWGDAVGVLLVTLLVEPLSRFTWAIHRRSWSGFKEILFGYGMLWRWMMQRYFY